MKEKEKALDLFNKFYIYTDGFAKENAKRFALIAVDEILKYQSQLLKNYKVELKNTYWEEVKQEIENL